ncbi:MAG: radical SAM protein [Christensenellales bacterium]
MTIKEHVTAYAVKRALKLLDEPPEKSLPKLLNWVDRLDPKDTLLSQRNAFRNFIHDKDSNWYQLMASLWTDVDSQVRKTLFENLVIHNAIIGPARQNANKKLYGCNIPWAILMDPTSACNLKCTGCWAAEYGGGLSMSYATLNCIIEQGKALGTYMYIYSGGEPLVRKDDIVRLCQAHPECVFLAFTNGTLIDEKFAGEMLRVKNFIPAISIEGFEEETDARRGAGTYKAVVRAMDILKKKKLPFGASCCYTSANTQIIGSEAYFDDMIRRGCKFAWFFTYMPVGKGACTELIATAGQREYMYHQIRALRNTKPIFTIDFWNDGEYVKGCIAGGRSYLHINANGDIEPCAFIHYSDSNIREVTLLQAYQSPLFRAYYEGQPFNDNHLRPCPLLDNPGALADMVEKSGARSTDLQHPEDVRDLAAKCQDAAGRWAPVAERLWTQCGGCADCGDGQQAAAK